MPVTIAVFFNSNKNLEKKNFERKKKIKMGGGGFWVCYRS